jgi:hypothetical protein
MPTKKHIRPGEKLPIKLTAAERTLVLDGLTCLDQEIEQVVRDTPSGQPVMMSLDDLDDFGGYVAAEANHCEDKRKTKKLDAIFENIQDLLGKFTDEEPPQTLKIEDARKDKVISDQSVQMEHFSLAPAQREVLSLVPSMTKTLKKKLATEKATFSIGEVASMTLALAEDLPDGDARKQVAVMYLAKHLMDHLQSGITAAATPKPTKKPKGKAKVASNTIFQFKITLLGSTPPIWRRIQVQDCTLDKLHEHIQTAMGWTNSHLHQFEIKGQRYGDPELLDDGFEDFDCEDSTTTMVSDILQKRQALRLQVRIRLRRRLGTRGHVRGQPSR